MVVAWEEYSFNFASCELLLENISGVPRVSGARGKKWFGAPFRDFPENFLYGRPKTNLSHFQKCKKKNENKNKTKNKQTKKKKKNRKKVISLFKYSFILSFQALAEPTTIKCFLHYYL